MLGHLLLRNVCRRRRQPKSAWSEYDRATCARTSARGAPGVRNSAKSSVYWLYVVNILGHGCLRMADSIAGTVVVS